MTSNSGKIENISEDDIEEIDQILKQSISLITRQTYKRGSTNLISAVITGLEYCSSRIYKYLQPLSIFEKISNFILVISTIILLKASRLLEFWTHISYKPLPNTIPVHPLIIRHLDPTFSPIFSFLAPHLVLIIQLVIISNFVSLMSSFAFYIVRNRRKPPSINLELDKIKVRAKGNFKIIISLSKLSPQSLNYYALQIKQRIKAIESNSKIASSIIPILALAYAAIVVYLIGSKKPGISFDVTFFLNASSYLLGVSPLAVIMFGYLVESTKQRLIMPLEECLTIIEQSLLIANKKNS